MASRKVLRGDVMKEQPEALNLCATRPLARACEAPVFRDMYVQI